MFWKMLIIEGVYPYSVGQPLHSVLFIYILIDTDSLVPMIITQSDRPRCKPLCDYNVHPFDCSLSRHIVTWHETCVHSTTNLPP